MGHLRRGSGGLKKELSQTQDEVTQRSNPLEVSIPNVSDGNANRSKAHQSSWQRWTERPGASE